MDLSLVDIKIKNLLATASVNSAGIVTLTSVTTAGAGYTSTTLPTVIAPLPSLQKELISGIRFVDGFAGIVTGIGTTVGTNGNSLALKFDVSFDTTADFDKLIVGYPIKVTQTGVGLGITSIDSQDSSIVGIGSTFVDNIYYVHAVSKNAFTELLPVTFFLQLIRIVSLQSQVILLEDSPGVD